MPKKSYQIVFELLQQHTTLDAVSNFLKEKDLTFSAQSWDKMISTRLIPALDANQITLDELNSLIAEGEEHGKQHIFLYEIPVALANELLSEGHVEKALKDKGLNDLPKLILAPEKPEIVDVRFKIGESLTIKSLDSRISKHIVSDEVIGTRQTVCWDLRTERAVNVVHLDKTGTIEVRLQSIAGASRYYINELQVFWDVIEGFIPFDKVSKTAVQRAKTYIWEHRNDLAKQVRYTDSILRNDNGFKIRATGDSNADINSDEATRNSLNEFYKMKGYCDTANIWLIREDEDEPAPIHVILSGDVNEYHLPQKCSRSDYEYCLRKLREFNKAISV